MEESNTGGGGQDNTGPWDEFGLHLQDNIIPLEDSEHGKDAI